MVTYSNSRYNVSILATKCKHLPFDARKTAHLDRLCLQNFLTESSAKFGRLFVVYSKEILLRLGKHNSSVTFFGNNVQIRRK